MELSALNSTSKAVAECFDKFFERITPSDAERRDAASRAREVSQEISLHMQVQGAMLTGSAARSTSIREFSDIDILIDLGARRDAEGSPDQVISQVAELLSVHMPDVSISENVVRLHFKDGLDVDVLVAFRAGADSRGFDVYRISSGDRQRWMTYAPGAQDQRIQEKGKRLGEGFKRIIRLIKWWNVHNESPMTSYGIEVLACETFDAAPMPEIPQAVVSIFDAAVLDSLYEQEATSVKLLESRDLARRALDDSLQGNVSRALECWRYLLGVQFPDIAS